MEIGAGVLNYASRQAWEGEVAGAGTKVVFAVVVVGRSSERRPRQGSAGTQDSLSFSTPRAGVGLVYTTHW